MANQQPHCTIMHSLDPDYTNLVILLTSKDLNDYIDEIETVEAYTSKKQPHKTILFDRFLSTGDTQDRFLSIEHHNGVFDKSTTKIVTPKDVIDEQTMQFLHDNFKYIDNSVLTDELRHKIKNHVAAW